MKHTLVALNLSAVLTTPAWSEYINNKQAWDNLSPAIQYGYAMGAYDEMFRLFQDDSETVRRSKLRIDRCVYDAQLSSADLADLINTTYRNDISIWKLPPSVVLTMAVFKYCG